MTLWFNGIKELFDEKYPLKMSYRKSNSVRWACLRRDGGHSGQKVLNMELPRMAEEVTPKEEKEHPLKTPNPYLIQGNMRTDHH